MFCFISNNVVVGIYVGVFEVAARLFLDTVNVPLGDADTESFAKFIRSTMSVADVDGDEGPPPPHQP